MRRIVPPHRGSGAANDEVDHKALFAAHRETTLKVITKALKNEPMIDWLLVNRDKVEHYFHELGGQGRVVRDHGR